MHLHGGWYTREEGGVQRLADELGISQVGEADVGDKRRRRRNL
jgi:hypothetical protein